MMTKYLGVEETAAFKALTRTLETRSSAFHEDIRIVEIVINFIYFIETIGY